MAKKKNRKGSGGKVKPGDTAKFKGFSFRHEEDGAFSVSYDILEMDEPETTYYADHVIPVETLNGVKLLAFRCHPVSGKATDGVEIVLEYEGGPVRSCNSQLA